MPPTRSNQAATRTNTITAHGKGRQTSLSDNASSPPAYSSVESAGPSSVMTTRASENHLRLPGLNPDLLEIPFNRYNIPESRLSEDKTTLTTTFPIYSSNPKALVELLRQQAALPPKPVVRIKGTHPDPHSAGPAKVDFDITLNMMPLIVRAQSERWNSCEVLKYSHSHAAVESESEASFTQEFIDSLLGDWAQSFCDKDSKLKSLTLSRTIVNWDTEYLSGQIRNVIASTRYAGNLSITFPVLNSKVIIAKPTTYLSYFGIPKWFGKLFCASSESSSSSPKKSLMLARQPPIPIVQTVWPYATMPPANMGSTSGSRECAVQSEQAWWHMWKGTIRNAILGSKSGWITAEDWIEVAMGMVAPEKDKEWGRGNCG